MSNKKSWTYTELTEATEREIKRQLVKADPEIERRWAFGAYMLWLGLTADVASQEDDKRLQALLGRADQNG